MTQKLIQAQTQTQTLQQVQRPTAQQMLTLKLIGMPIAELEDNVVAEIGDNPALERADDEESAYSDGSTTDGGMDDDAMDNASSDGDNDDYRDADSGDIEAAERQERSDELDSALENLGSDDAMPEAHGGPQTDNTAGGDMIYEDEKSFYDRLYEQMDMQELSSREHDIMEYLIGSLDDDGLLRKQIDTIADEMAIYHNIDATEDEIKQVLHRLQGFDPAGVGARSLQECLLLQIARRRKSTLTNAMDELIREHFDDFVNKKWDIIKRDMGIKPDQLKDVLDEIKKLNPRPGAAMSEDGNRKMEQITPDFIVDTADDGSISLTLNQGDMPELMISPSFSEMVETYRNHKETMSRRDKEALLYAKEKVDKARGYIDAIRQRRHTMYKTMKAIIKLQHKFFEDGDETDLRPMKLKDVAQRIGMEISTVSRVCVGKYCQTKWGIFPLRFFFNDSYTTGSGEETTTRKIKLALKDIISHEDKAAPLSDDALMQKMAEKGYPIARRTVSKYREQMAIPVARMRRQ